MSPAETLQMENNKQNIVRIIRIIILLELLESLENESCSCSGVL